jgi:hypothetical protein
MPQILPYRIAHSLFPDFGFRAIDTHGAPREIVNELI